MARSVMLKKYWTTALIKESKPKTPRILTTANSQLDIKIKMASTLLAANFSNCIHLIRHELSKPTWTENGDNPEYLSQMIHKRINSLWLENLRDFVLYITLSTLRSLTNSSNKESFQRLDTLTKLRNGILPIITEEMIRYIIECEKLKEKISTLCNDISESWDEFTKEVQRAITNSYIAISNESYKSDIITTLSSIQLTGHSQYMYVCSGSDSTCDDCAGLSGQIFDVSDAQFGVNLPPMHPNCRCTITAYPAEPFHEIIDWDKLQEIWESLPGKIETPLDDIADAAYDIWQFFFDESFQEFYGTFETINIEGAEYRINKNTFSAVAIGPDGNLIVPENASEYDIQLLELMKQRDALEEVSNERHKIETQIQEIIDSTDSSMRKVNPNQTYDFYVLSSDITDQLDEFMRQTEIDYADMHNRYWVSNLLDFMDLVRNGSIMDLKNQPEWQHSACIYDGEIVDRDALGNINYGFFGRHCNIPESVLMAGAGFAQVSAGTSDWEFWFALFDDPRDSYRLMQGVEIYEESH